MTIVTYLVYITISYFHIAQDCIGMLREFFAQKHHCVGFCFGEQVSFITGMICDVKNNKRSPKDDRAHHIRLKPLASKSEEFLVVKRLPAALLVYE